MPDNTLTFEIGGQIELKDLEEGIRLFTQLINALTPREGVAWIVHDLQSGSADVTLKCEAAEAVAGRVMHDCESIGKHMSNGTSDYEPELFASDKRGAMEAAKKIRAFAASESIEYVGLQTESVYFTVRPIDASTPPAASSSTSIGAITGRVQTLNSRRGLKFTLYDDIHDKAVTCFLKSGQEGKMREVWGRRAKVTGAITRDADDKPKSISEVAAVELLEEVPPDAYKQARGAIPWTPGDELPEEVIRRMRDAW